MLGDRREAYYDSLLTRIGPRYANYEALSIRVALDLIFTGDILQQTVSCEFARYGLSRSTYNILMLLHHGPSAGMQLHDLGELLLVSRANITGLIDHLEQKELVTRSVDQADRRARFARITASGQALLETLIPAHNRTVQLLLQEMTSAEKQMLVKLLKKMRLSLAAAREACAAKLPARMKTNKD